MLPSAIVTLSSNANTVFEPLPAPTGIGDKKCAFWILTVPVSKSIPLNCTPFDALLSLESIENITPGVILSEPLSGDEYFACPNGPAVTGNELSTLQSTLTYLERFT